VGSDSTHPYAITLVRFRDAGGVTRGATSVAVRTP
jgi:hypothetical protein